MPETEVPLLQDILSALHSSAGGAGTIIVNGTAVTSDTMVFNYFDSGYTNVQTIVYKSGGTTVATQTFAYVQNPVTTANASVQAIVIT